MGSNGGKMVAKPLEKRYFFEVLAVFLARRSALALQFLLHTVFGLFFGFSEGTHRPQPGTCSPEC